MVWFAIIAAVVLIFIIWLWLIAPRHGMKKQLESLAKHDYAHRGLHNNEKGQPENSLMTFRMAAEAGFGIELDLQLTKDKKVVVHHDADLKRSCGHDVRVADKNLSELSEYRLFGTDEQIPTFEDTLKAVGKRVPLIVEIKTYQKASEICPLVWDILKDYDGEYCVESFEPSIVQWFKVNVPQVVRGQLMDRLEKGTNGLSAPLAFLGRNMLSNFYTRPDFEAYNFLYRKNPSLRLARRVLHMQEVSWTLKSWEQYEAAKAEGCICIFEGFEPFAKTEKVSFEPAAEQSRVPAPLTTNRTTTDEVNN